MNILSIYNFNILHDQKTHHRLGPGSFGDGDQCLGEKWRGFPLGLPRNHPFFSMGIFHSPTKNMVFFLVFMGIFPFSNQKNGFSPGFHGDFSILQPKIWFFSWFSMGIFPLKKTNQQWDKMGYSSKKMDSQGFF